MQEAHGNVAHRFFAIVQLQAASRPELTDHHRLDVLPVADGFQPRPVFRRHRQHHPLLRLAQPDFPRAQAGVLERDGVQLHPRADLLAHLAHRRRQPARAAVRNGAVQPLVARAQNGLHRLLLVDRMADLHRAAGDGAGVLVNLHAGKRRPAQPVAPGAPADDDDQITRLCLCTMRPARQDAQTAAKHQRIRRVATIIKNRAVHGGNAHLVAIILNAADHAFGNTARMQHPRR